MFKPIKFGLIALIFFLETVSASFASDVSKYQQSLGDRTYRFGLSGFESTIAYLSPKGSVVYVRGWANPRVVSGRWKVIEKNGTSLICLKAAKGHSFWSKKSTCYKAKRFRSFLKDWAGNPLGLRRGRKLRGNIGVRPSFAAIKRALQ